MIAYKRNKASVISSGPNDCQKKSYRISLLNPLRSYKIFRARPGNLSPLRKFEIAIFIACSFP